MDISNLTPEQIQQILGGGEDDPALAQAANRQRTVDALQRQAMAPDPGRMMGRIYHGGGLGGPVRQIMQGLHANKMQGEVDGMNREAHGRTVQGRQAYGTALIDALRRRQPQGPASPQTPPISGVDPQTEQDPTGPAPFGGY